MELTLAEEIRALLEMVIKRDPYAITFRRDSQVLWDAFPALAARMLAVIAERDSLRNRWALTNRQAMEELTDTQDSALKKQSARVAELEKERDTLLRPQYAHSTTHQAPLNPVARIAELKENAVRWETRYRGAMEQFTEERNYHIHTLKKMQAAQKECDRLRFEAECLQVTVAK